MTCGKSEGLSNSESRPAGRLRRFLLAGLLILLVTVAAAAFFGPTLLLRLALDRLLPRAANLEAAYDRAEAGLFARSLTLDGLTLTGEHQGRLTVGRLQLLGVSPVGLWRLWRNPAAPARVADELRLTEAALESDGLSLTAASLDGRGCQWPGEGGEPLFIHQYFSRLRVRGFNIQIGRGPGLIRAGLEALAAEKTARDLTLNLSQATLVTGGDSLWADLAGRRLDLDLALALPRDTGRPEALKQRLSLAGADLGRLELSADLTGLKPGQSAASPRGLLAALAPASLLNLNLGYEDRGFMSVCYAWLARTEFRDLPGLSVPEALKKTYLLPLLEELELSSSAANAEAALFLDRPESFSLRAAPPRPLRFMALALANKSKYDIIKRLHLTLTVNGRPPVDVAP